MSNNKPFRVAQIGFRHEHADGKMRTLRKYSDEFEVVGIVDDRHSTTPAYKRDDLSFADGIPIISEEQALTDPSIEAVLIEVTNGDLVPYATRAAQHGKHMHMDKPTGEELQPFIDLVEICRAKKLYMQLGYMFRANKAVLFAQKAVKEGWLGDIVSAEADMNHGYGGDTYQDYMGTFKGGIIYSLGCHLIDMIMPMMPGLPIRTYPVIKSAPGDREGAATMGVTVMEWPRSTATIHASSRVNIFGRRRLRVVGTKGWIEICPIERFDGVPEKVEMCITEAAGGYEAGYHEIDFGVHEDRYVDQLRQLKQIVRGEIPMPDDYDYNIMVHKAVLMACGYI